MAAILSTGGSTVDEAGAGVSSHEVCGWGFCCSASAALSHDGTNSLAFGFMKAGPKTRRHGKKRMYRTAGRGGKRVGPGQMGVVYVRGGPFRVGLQRHRTRESACRVGIRLAAR